MKKILLLILSLIFCSATMHVQSIGICTIKETEDAIEYSFVFPKENIPQFHKSLKDYKDDVKDLLVLKNIIHENIGITINDKVADLKYDTTISELRFVTLKFKTTNHQDITSLTIKNKGLDFTNEHFNSFDFWLYLQNKKRLFKLKADRKTLKAIY